MAVRKPAVQTPAAPPKQIVARVRRCIVEQRLIDRGDRVLAAVSGGPDSTCLLLGLAALRRSLRFELRAAHFDHGLRGARAAMREQRFVRELCAALDVPLHTGAGDVRAKAKDRSLEDAAREARYRFLANVAREEECNIVAAGHTKDDQAETILMHIIRGSGINGLAGMAARVSWPVASRKSKASPRLVRPLLDISRGDTEHVCRECGVTPLLDPSNQSDVFLRNRVRRDLLPLLRTYNPKIEDALVRVAASASTESDMLDAVTAAIVESSTAGAARVRRRPFLDLSPNVQAHVIRHCVEALLGSARGLSARHIRAIALAAQGPTGATLDLPRRVHVRVRRDMLEFSIGRPRHARALLTRPVPLEVGTPAAIGPWRVAASYRKTASPHFDSDALTAFLDADAVGDHLVLRRRRDGDRFQPLGMSRSKKLQDFFVDAHVPRDERDGIPLLVGDHGIAWLIGHRPAEWAKITPRTKTILWLRASRA